MLKKHAGNCFKVRSRFAPSPPGSVEVTKSSNSSGRLMGPLTGEIHFTRRFQSTPGSLTHLPVRKRDKKMERENGDEKCACKEVTQM
jgi:hypothetical protein